MNFNLDNTMVESPQQQQQQQENESLTLNMANNNGVTSEDPGVIEVMASPESDGAFTEDMINQIISMLQTEGQITTEIHTVIIHTPSGTMLRVQIQQVDGAELEQENVEEIPSTEVVPTGLTEVASAGTIVQEQQAQQHQDQLVYIGQSGDEFQTEQQQQQQQFISANDQVLQNGGGVVTNQHQQQYLTLEQPHVVVSANGQNIVESYNGSGITTEAPIPSSLMNDVAEQVLQAANIIDGGYRTADNNNIMIQQPVVNGVGLHTTSLNNGVVLSYEEPSISNITPQYQMEPVTINSNLVQHGNRSNRNNNNKGKINNNNSQYIEPIISANSHSGYRRNNLNKTGGHGSRSTIVNKKKLVMVTHTITDDVVRIRIDTGHNITDRKPICLDDHVIRIKTTTGQIKPRTPKFFRCTSCTIHFVTEQSLLQHIKNGCIGSKKKTSYECTYCLAKFSSKAKTMEHLRICTKRSQMKNKKNQHLNSSQNKTTHSKVTANPVQAVEVEIHSDDDDASVARQEKNIVYDDDDEVDIDLAADTEDYETTIGKVSQKHLGPILTGGKFQCRDCDRTFAKDSQYKRHEGACTNAPLNASRIDTGITPQSEKKFPDKKRGRPKSKFPVGKPKLSSAGEPNKKKVATVHDDTVIEWDFLSANNSKKSNKKNNTANSANIMDMLNENIKSNLIDGGKELSESFLQCLDSSDAYNIKAPTPNKSKPTVCGLCIRHMSSNDALAEHITAMHGKDVVNMHAILTNNTDLKTHKCTLCDLHFVSSEAINNHIVAKHNDKLQDSLKTLRANSMDVPCPWCSEKIMSTELFQQHLAIEHTSHFPEAALTPAMKPEELDAKSLKAAMIANSFSPGDSLVTGRICMNCGISFNKLKELDTHYKTCSKISEKKEWKHICYFTNCKDEQYNTLADLISHIEQEHTHIPGAESRMFPNHQLFTTWLSQLIQKISAKFSLVTTKIRAGCSYSTYLCPQYNTLKDSTTNVRCFSRLHVRTRWCHSKFDYSGRTEVVYFKEHNHEAVKSIDYDSIVTDCKNLKVQFSSADKLSCDQGSTAQRESSPDPEITIKKSLSPPSPSAPSSSHKNKGSSLCNDKKTLQINGNERKELNKTNKKIPNEPINKSIRTPVSSRFTSPPDENSTKQNSNSSSSLVNKKKRMREDYSDTSDTELNSTPNINNSKITNANKSLTSSTISNKSNLNNNSNIINRKSAPKRKLNSTTLSTNGPPPSKKAKTSSSSSNTDNADETTYVLPANLSEWGKLFDMVKSQMDTGSLSSNRSGASEAKGLLRNQNKITSLPLEEQVRVFNRLCSLANIQVD